MQCEGGCPPCRIVSLSLSHIVTLAIGIYIGTRIVKCCEKKKAVEEAKKSSEGHEE